MTKLIQKLSIIQRDLKAPKSQTNNFGKYKYRSCEDILQAVKPMLDGLVLTLTDEVVALSDRVYVKATVSITDGNDYINVHGWARESATKKGMDDSQITGITSSYARKYALNGLLYVDETQDDDSLNDHAKGHIKKWHVAIKKWQVEEINQLVSSCDVNIAKGCIHVSKKRTDKVDELNGAEADQLIELLLIKAKVKKKGFDIHEYSKNRWKYKDGNGIEHLIHDGKEVASGKYVHSYSKKRWMYTDDNHIQHLIHDGKEVTTGKYVHSYSMNKWGYKDDGYVYIIKRKKT